MPGVKEFYADLSELCSSISGESINGDTLPLISSSHACIDDYNTWATVLKDKPEYVMYESAIREYQISILANTIGLYNLSFTGLRFFYERTLTAIMFSSREIELRLWMKGQRDTYWNDICDVDKGLFSPPFYNAFFPDLKDDVKHYLTIGKKVYRECSEYVHGNTSTQDRVPKKLEYSEELCKEWHEKADTIKDVVLFAFCLRYLPYLSAEQKGIVEQSVLDNLSHIEPIRSLLQQPH
jgi:hypothetical protein